MSTLSLSMGALADTSRQKIVALLAERARSVVDLQRHFRFSQPALSKHLRTLRDAGLVVFEKRGRSHLYALKGDTLRDAADWLLEMHGFWRQRLDALGDVLDEETER